MRASSKYNHRIQEAKQTINQIINDVEDKKRINIEGVQMIQSVNADALGFYQGNNQHRGSQWTEQGANRSKFRHPHAKRGYSTEIDSNQCPDFSKISHVSPNKKNLLQQNQQLRKALEFQRSKKSTLLQKLHYLEHENRNLKSQLHLPLQLVNSKYARSTNYNSVFEGISRPASPRYETSHTGHIGSRDAQERDLLTQLGLLKDENDRLRKDAVRLLRKDY